MLSSDTKYLLKLYLTKSPVFRTCAGQALILAASAAYALNKYWLFCKLLGKYEKLNESEIISNTCSKKYQKLFQLRCSLLCAAENPIHKAFLLSKKCSSIKKLYNQFGSDNAVKIRYKNEDNPDREGNLLILKPSQKLSDGVIEKGVIYLQYNNSILEFASLFNLKKLYEEYSLIVEPSSWGYSDLGLELLLHGEHRLYVMAQDSIDFQLCQRLDKRLIPIRAGAGDWINFSAACTKESEKIFDVCMIASWRKLKNHKLLFKQLSSLGKGLRIALVGYPWEGRTAASIRAEQNKYYPDSLVSIFESVPHEYVFDVLSKSKVALMLSEREGANRGIYEALASNVPVIMLENNRGVNKLLVSNNCIITANANNLGSTVQHYLNSFAQSNVRERLLSISGTQNTWKTISDSIFSTEQINLCNEPIICSTPNLRYVSPEIKSSMDERYTHLKSFLNLT